MAAPTPNSVGWFILEGYPWWPVFVVDQYKLRPKLYHLGDGHRGILKKARDFPKDYAIVYYFGSHEFSLAHLNKGVLRTWDCDDKEDFLKGHPKHLAKKKATMDDLTFSIQEAEDYLAQPEDIRLPPYFVPSDLDPTLEPPPPPEIEEDEEGSDEENVSDAGDAEDPDAEEGAQSDDHEEDDEEDEDAPTKKNAKKKKEKKEKPKKEKKEKKKDKKKDKKSDTKEKKTAKASSSKEKKKTPKSPKAEPKKRKAEAVEKIASSKSPSKASKHAAGEDVKSADVKTEKSGRKDVKMADPESDADLTAKLEKEIRWILLNCQFEEMTTKTVRKLLEKRLEMDLRHHKASIKEGVARVIQSMEDDTNQDADQEAGQEAGGKSTEDASAQSVKAEPPQPEATAAVKEEVKSDPSVIKIEVKSDPSVIKNEVKSDPSVIKDKIKSDPSAIKDEIKSDPSAANESSSPKKVENAASSSKIPVAEQLEDAAKRLSASPLSDEQILDILTSVAAISSVDPNVLKKSKLQERLVALVSHSSSVVSSKVLALGKQWDIETVLSPKKEVDLNYLKELKAKLENSDTSHEDICTSLDELAEMPLQISHLKKTKIARTVANLRQHANDRVSSKANSLRRSWIQTLSKENPENVETLKTLKKMHETLAQRDDQSDKPGDVHSAQLEILNKLLGMTLRTQDIIDSKVGVVVSKLRKSSDEKVAKAASKLRKKWKSEAGAA